jgi:release factor glutamine methyltransferase
MSAEPGRRPALAELPGEPPPDEGPRQERRPASGATWRDLIGYAAGALGSAHEARFIVEDVAETRGPLLGSRLELAAPATAAAQIVEMVDRRGRGEPLQHVLGHWSFRTLDVIVDSRALVPRPETEAVTEVALRELDRLAAEARRRDDPRLKVVDLGTGSGVIALSIATERAFAEVTATDRSPSALELAAENLRRRPAEVQSRLHLACGEWYSPLPESLEGAVAVIVSNPPYLARDEWDELDEVVRHDPYEALVAGETGMESIEAVVGGSGRWLSPRGSLVVEIAPFQAERACAIAAAVCDHASRPLFESVEVLPDLAGRQRVLLART